MHHSICSHFNSSPWCGGGTQVAAGVTAFLCHIPHCKGCIVGSHQGICYYHIGVGGWCHLCLVLFLSMTVRLPGTACSRMVGSLAILCAMLQVDWLGMHFPEDCLL